MGPPDTLRKQFRLRLLGYTGKDRSPSWGLHLGDRSALTHTAVLFILRAVETKTVWAVWVCRDQWIPLGVNWAPDKSQFGSFK